MSLMHVLLSVRWHEGRFKGKTAKKDKNNALADRALEHLKAFEESVAKLTE